MVRWGLVTFTIASCAKVHGALLFFSLAAICDGVIGGSLVVFFGSIRSPFGSPFGSPWGVRSALVPARS